MKTNEYSIPSVDETNLTTERVATAAHQAIDDAAVRAKEVEQQVRGKAALASEKLETSKEEATHQVERSVEKLESFVKGQPFAAAGIAFAAGVLATTLLRR